MSVLIAGVEYVTISEVVERFPGDVTYETVRNWWRSGRLPLVRDPDGVPIQCGGEYVCRWPDAVEAEYAPRSSGRGRPRAAA